MSIPIKKRLEQLGYCHIKRDCLDDAIADARHDICPEWSADELLLHPEKAIDVCHHVRKKLDAGLPYNLILRRMINNRKQAVA